MITFFVSENICLMDLQQGQEYIDGTVVCPQMAPYSYKYPTYQLCYDALSGFLQIKIKPAINQQYMLATELIIEKIQV